jgi:hypothetical protein
MKKALILLGCPESPSQTPLAIYTSYKLDKMGFKVTLASTPSAMKLLEVSDPEGYYIKNKIDLETCLDTIKEGDYQLLIGFAHKDAAVSYFVTFYYILNTESIALVFHRDAEKLESFKETIKSSTDAEIVSARAYHNPTPIRVRLDRALKSLEEL